MPKLRKTAIEVVKIDDAEPEPPVMRMFDVFVYTSRKDTYISAKLVLLAGKVK